MLVRILAVVFTVSMAIMLVALVTVTGPMFEQQIAPVLVGQRIVDLDRSGDVVTWKVEVDKVRDCRLVQVDYAVQEGISMAPILVRNHATDYDANVTYPRGHYLLGPFVATLPSNFQNADVITGMVFYDCHPGWVTRQEFGTVQVPPAPPPP